MFKAAFVIPTLDQSGAEHQMTLLAEGLAGRKYEVHVIALVRGGYFEKRLKAAGVHVHVLGKRFRFDPRSWSSVRRLLKRIHPDIVQSFLFSANTLVRLPGVVPDSAGVVVSERCVDSWKSRWQLRLDRRLAKRADAMTANSNSVKEFYTQLGMPPERIEVIRNGLPAAPQQNDRAWIRDQLNLSPALRLVGYVGRLAEQKRGLDLLWAFQLLHQLIDDSDLVEQLKRQWIVALVHRQLCFSRVSRGQRGAGSATSGGPQETEARAAAAA